MSHPKALLDSLGIRALKRLSQNFLTSPHWAETLVKAALEGDPSEVWEVGPGLGALTTGLLEKANVPVTAFELDKALTAYLKETYPALTVIHGDFLDFDLAAAVAGKERIGFLSNVPYNISSALLFRLIPFRRHFTRFVLTFQKEYGERLAAKPRTPDYGSLSVMIQTHFSLQSLGVIPPGAFYPRPDVDSVAVVLTPLPASEVEGLPFEKVVRAAFAHRRKKLSSNLKAEFAGVPVERLLGELGFLPTVRPEELTREAFAALARRIAENSATC